MRLGWPQNGVPSRLYGSVLDGPKEGAGNLTGDLTEPLTTSLTGYLTSGLTKLTLLSPPSAILLLCKASGPPWDH